MGLHLKAFGAQRVTNFDLTRASDAGSPVALYDRLVSYRAAVLDVPDAGHGSGTDLDVRARSGARGDLYDQMEETRRRSRCAPGSPD